MEQVETKIDRQTNTEPDTQTYMTENTTMDCIQVATSDRLDHSDPIFTLHFPLVAIFSLHASLV